MTNSTATQTIHFYGAKGGVGTSTVAVMTGVGTSTVAVMTALEAARTGYRVGLLADSLDIVNDLNDLRAIAGIPTSTDGLYLRFGPEDGTPMVVVDHGSVKPAASLFSAEGHRHYVVTTSCYLALRRLVGMQRTVDGIVLLADPSRSLQVRDVEDLTDLPVVAELPVEAAFARMVDAGLMAKGTRGQRSLGLVPPL